MRFFVSNYGKVSPKAAAYDGVIKWSRNLKRRLAQGRRERFDAASIRPYLYRPYTSVALYDSTLFLDERGSSDAMFSGENVAICFSDSESFRALASGLPFDLHFIGDSIGLPRKRFASDGKSTDNITDWALAQFRKRYAPNPALPRKRGRESGAERSIGKEAIFHYVYAVLHNPVYREKYALNLKREFPRIPFYADFWQWADWGRALMDAHIGYESVAPFALTRRDVPDERARRAGLPPKTLLRADKAAGTIALDSETTLAGVPPVAWDYRLGNRSALEWVLDQYKEKTPRDPTIRERFDTYRFADYKERVIDLLARVTTVSVETMRIVEAMKSAAR